MLGDQGVIENRAEDGSRARKITIKAPFIEDSIFPKGQLTRLVTLSQISLGGNDILQGGRNGDWLHGGAGNDLMNGNSGDDRLFGDDGSDAVWGGTQHDHVYGSYGRDSLDVVPRLARASAPADPSEWFVVAATADSYQHIDFVYGGWDADQMQADTGGPGTRPGDRLLDWAGDFNIYYVCAGAYGEGVITRMPSPDMLKYLIDMATGDGAVDVATRDKSGFNELGLVNTSDMSKNSHPAWPGPPGHFTCVP
jgi:Ca2+-binding RTX toxin-like protein